MKTEWNKTNKRKNYYLLPFTKYFLSTFYVLDTVLCAGNTEWYNGPWACPHGVHPHGKI